MARDPEVTAKNKMMRHKYKEKKECRMEKERRERIYELLKRGIKLIENNEELPVEWAQEFFPPERREYELIYHGKESEEKILADTMAVPLQPVSTFGTNGVDWHNMLILGDNLQAMKTLLQMKERGELINADGTSGVRLIYIDPPFATKRDFKGSQDQKAYQDKIAGAEFLEFLRRRLILLRELLSDHGSIYVHLDSRKGHYIKVILDEVFSGYEFAEIAWICGLMGSGKFYPKAHENIYCYKSSKAIFNPPSRIGLSPRITKALQKDKEGWFYTRGKESSGGSAYLKSYICNNPKLTKEQAIIFANNTRPQQAWSVWMGKRELAYEFNDNPVGTYAYTEKESIGYPTQKPEALIDRIIRASSKEGDIILDAFAGSGTTCAVAEKLNRRWIGIDCGKLAVYTVQKRILNLRTEIGNSGKPLHSKPFKLYNAGLYDFETLRQLPWEDWRFFALQLFECKDEPHKIRGFQMDGKRQGSSVLVFNHFDKGTVSRETISDIHANIGKQVGERCFIIAPRGAFLFQEDYIELDAVRYYALRIPYSYINELHRREFSALTQPSDETAVNETVEAVGFDFIQPPLVEFEIKERSGSASIKIEKFESRARLRGEEKISKHDALSMVMVDFDYNGKVFDLDRVFYADVLKNNLWKVEFSIKDVTGDVMLVFLDIYGNESRIIIEQKKLTGKAKRPKRRSYK